MARSKTNRKGGGQPANKNAQKHGFYSALYTRDEQKRLSGKPRTEHDLEMLRTLAYRIARHLHFKTLAKTELAGAGTLTLIMQLVNTSERTLLLAKGKGGEIGKTILEALMDLDPHKEL